jgi:hypothetical protein
MVTLNGREVVNIEVDGVDTTDHPDYCDAYFSHAEFLDGTALTDEELEKLTDECGDLLNEMANNYYY